MTKYISSYSRSRVRTPAARARQHAAAHPTQEELTLQGRSLQAQDARHGYYNRLRNEIYQNSPHARELRPVECLVFACIEHDIPLELALEVL